MELTERRLFVIDQLKAFLRNLAVRQKIFQHESFSPYMVSQEVKVIDPHCSIEHNPKIQEPVAI